jgi:hypothetical protein
MFEAYRQTDGWRLRTNTQAAAPELFLFVPTGRPSVASRQFCLDFQGSRSSERNPKLLNFGRRSPGKCAKIRFP